jgi:hypothetical protein
MPASNKMLKAREHAKNRAAGIGDENGRMPSRVKAANVMGQCTKCMAEIRMTSTNTEAKDHWNSRHSTFTFAECFPGHFDPTAPKVEAPIDASAVAAQAQQNQPKKKDKKEDLSFLQDALNAKPGGKAGGKKK